MARSVEKSIALRGVMFIQFRPPPDRLAMPDVCCDLVWTREQLILCGPASRGHRISWPNEDIQLLNIDPLVARAWLGVPLTHLVNQQVPCRRFGETYAVPSRICSTRGKRRSWYSHRGPQSSFMPALRWPLLPSGVAYG